jgi:hypothetical protein
METKTVRQVGQDLLRLQERLETEKTARCALHARMTAQGRRWWLAAGCADGASLHSTPACVQQEVDAVMRPWRKARLTPLMIAACAGAVLACCAPACREGDVNQLRSEVHEVLGNRNMTDEKFQAVVLDEIAGLKVRRGVVRGCSALAGRRQFFACDGRFSCALTASMQRPSVVTECCCCCPRSMLP